MFQLIEKEVHCFKTSDEESGTRFACSLEGLLKRKLKDNHQVVILCVGSDYIVGDCLGPLVGYKLNAKDCGLPVYGDFNYTVHAGNIIETVTNINKKYADPFILTVDSALSFDCAKIGEVKITEGGLFAGIAFGKALPSVGQISITGTTNSYAAFEKYIRTTRMKVVMQLANFIETGLSNTFNTMNLTGDSSV